MSVVSSLRSLLSKFVGLFTSGKAQAAINTVAALIPKAVPIIQLIAAATPTRSDDELIALFAKYGLPFVTNYLALPVEKRGGALLDAASTLLARQFPGVPTHQLQAAIGNALVGLRAEEASKL